MNRWVNREGSVVERGGVPVVEFHSACAVARGDGLPVPDRAATASGGYGCAACSAGSARRLPVMLLALDDSARPGDQVSVRVGVAALNRLATVCFALPLVALLAGAAVAGLLPTASAIDADVVSGLVGLGCLALVFVMVGRSGGALLRMLDLHARLVRTDK
jgi:positive regulator of sigma E activity